MKRLREFWLKGHADAEGSSRAWYKEAEAASWTRYSEIKRDFPSADQVGDKIVFNICGNRYRLIVVADYARKGILVKWVGTHAEYSQIDVRDL